MAKKAPSRQKSSQQLVTAIIVIGLLLVLIYLFYQNQPSAQVLWGD